VSLVAHGLFMPILSLLKLSAKGTCTVECRHKIEEYRDVEYRGSSTSFPITGTIKVKFCMFFQKDHKKYYGGTGPCTLPSEIISR
jgi:hypothetical protein